MLTATPTTRGLWYPDGDTDLDDVSGLQSPKKFLFSLTGKCNLRCDHCPRGVFDVVAHETPVELIDHVINDILPAVRSIRIGGTDLGEQLTSRHFNRFLEAIIATQPKHLEIVSNLTVLDEPRADLIARACDDFGLSIEGIGPAFERVRHFPWARIDRHLDLLSEARSRHPESRLEVFCLVTCFHDNLHDLEATLELADRGVRRFDFRLFRPNVPEQASQALEHHRLEANRVFARIRDVAEGRGIRVSVPPPFPIAPLVPPTKAQAPASPDKHWVCHFPFEAMSLYSDGRVSPCCEEIYLGQVDRQAPDLLKIFRSEPWRELRTSLATGKFTGRCVDCELRKSRQAELDLSARAS